MTDRLRVGVVSYLNTEPLIVGLADDVPEAELVEDVPSRLAEALAEGRLDVAIVSSIEYATHPGYRIVGDACIASRGEVLSVRLFARVPPERIRRVALDAASRASTALAEVLLRRRWGLEPRIDAYPIPGELDGLPEGVDAVMLIGDRCMRTPVAAWPHVVDLGRAWTDWTGLPFVYAMWTARPAVDLGRLPEALDRARDRGVASVEEVARTQAARHGLDADVCRDYLVRLIHYRLGPDERRGLERYYREAAAVGLAPPGRTLEFYGD